MVDHEQALAFALYYISLHNLIDCEDERHTLLTGRLVCRAWRNCEAFSGKIMSVTLHRLADIHLATRFFPNTESVRHPWRRVEDVPVFPNLATLRLPEYLCRELPGSLEFSWLIDLDLEPFDVEITEMRPSIFRELEPFLSRIPSVSSLHLIRCEELVQDDGTMPLLNDVANLTGLTRLVLGELRSLVGIKIGNLAVLSRLPYLDELYLEDVDIFRLDQFVEWTNNLCLFSTFSTLEYLSVSIKLFADSIEEIPEVKRLLTYAKFGFLYSCELTFIVEDEDIGTEYRVILRHDSPDGVELLVSDIDMTRPANEPHTIPIQLHTLVQQGAPSECYYLSKLIVPDGLPDEKVLVDLTWTPAVDQIRGQVEYTCSQPETRLRPMPVFAYQPSLQVSTTRLDLRISHISSEQTFMSGLFTQLPPLFPHLQCVEIRTDSRCQFEGPSCIQALTKLTHLTLRKIATPDGYLTSFSFLPTSLRSLCLHVFQSPSLPKLENLTGLVLEVLQGDLSLDSVFACQAPLKELSLHCLADQAVDLHAIVTSFPRLEVLDMSIGPCDVSPLSYLVLLGKLSLKVAKHEGIHYASHTCFTGLNRLTALKVLEVTSASELTVSICEIVGLTQLRHLTYLVENAESGSTIGLDTWKESVFQPLYLALPSTHVDVTTVELKNS